ncbi:hypothetical protein CSC94_19060 [Zhengella mangrovi]|uniref:Uncharacterized protein n=1 Tax=Zhengella mangrovi TaxID=1982044 RepID=A0A2G1QIT5_9HYPH|nr:hypothetical protein CSC94_19060 [Zhengella mangrovi]
MGICGKAGYPPPPDQPYPVDIDQTRTLAEPADMRIDATAQWNTFLAPKELPDKHTWYRTQPVL